MGVKHIVSWPVEGSRKLTSWKEKRGVISMLQSLRFLYDLGEIISCLLASISYL